MPSPVTHRGVAVAGLVGLMPIALGLIQGSLTLDAAAIRALVLLTVLTVVDRLLVPIGSSLLGPPKRRQDDQADQKPG